MPEDSDNDVTFRAQFSETMEGTYWKAIQKAEGLTQEEIIHDVLGCSESQQEIGTAYLEALKRKFA